MKLNYYILWVEDDNSWFQTAAELFEGIVTDYGFHPIIERKKTLDEVSEELKKTGLKRFDIFLIDFKLRNSSDGDSIIDFLRDKDIYTDIIFYSSDKQSIIDSIKEHLFEGVYHSDRAEIESKFEKIFRTTIKKIEEINSMRGLIVGETSELDTMIEESLIRFFELGVDKKVDIDAFIEKQVFDNHSKRDAKLKETYKNEGVQGVFPLLDSIKKWRLLREILYKNKTTYSYAATFLELNSPYLDEVIEIRNKFAHAVVVTGEDGTEFLRGLPGKADFAFDEHAFKAIRANLKKHRDSLVKLKSSL